MHFIRSAPPLALSTLALASSVLGLASATHPFSLSPRSFPVVDICADVDVSLAAGLLDLLGIRLPAHVCLCVGTIPGLIQVNADVRAAVSLLGVDKVTTTLTALINECPNNQYCQYPAHSRRVCTSGNPCAYECTDGYSKNNNGLCYCPANKYECDGTCQSAPCPTSSARLHRRSKQLALTRCPIGLEKCGVPGRGDGRPGYECLDTRSNLESCGGCTTPLAGMIATGRDCSTIANVSSVSCVFSQCVVESCRPGYTPDSISGTQCILLTLDA